MLEDIVINEAISSIANNAEREREKKDRKSYRMPQKHIRSKAEYTKSMDTRKKRTNYHVKSSKGQKITLQ